MKIRTTALASATIAAAALAFAAPASADSCMAKQTTYHKGQFPLSWLGSATIGSAACELDAAVRDSNAAAGTKYASGVADQWNAGGKSVTGALNSLGATKDSYTE